MFSSILERLNQTQGTKFMYDPAKVEEILTAVHGCKADCVQQISEHFAGYFDEIGITVSVKDDTTDDSLRDLKNKMSTALARIDTPFGWMVAFQREGKSAGVLFPDGLFTGATNSSRVAVVLEPESKQLESMASAMPVWAVESPSNRLVAERFWSKFPNANQRDIGLTLFKSELNHRYDSFVGVLDTLEEHHWGLRQLYVVGLELTEQVQTDMQVLGFNAYTHTTQGFVATKNG